MAEFSFEDALGVSPAAAEEAEPKPKSFSFEDAKQPPTGPMPNLFTAGMQGIRAGTSDVGQSVTALSSVAPEPEQETSPAAAPFEWGDIAEPLNKGAPKVAYRLGKSYPTAAAGIAGGLIGGGVGTVAGGPGVGTATGSIMGGAAGAGAGAAFQTIGPVFGAELKKSPQDPEGAWTRAMQQAAVSGMFSGASWAAFPLRFFNGPVKNLAFQAFGVQPGISVGEQATKNVMSGEPATKDLGQAYTEGAVGTAVPAIGHAAVKAPFEQGVTGPIKPVGPTADPSNSAVKNFWVKNFQPELFSEAALQAEPQFAKYKSGSAQEKDAIINRAENNYYRWNSIPENDQLGFMDAHERGMRFADPWYQDRSNAYRDTLQEAHDLESMYGSKAGFVEDYLPHIYEDPAKATQVFQNKTTVLGPQWFQRARYYDLIQEGLKSGLKLATTNPEELVTRRLLSGVDMRQRVMLLDNLEGMGLAYHADQAPAHVVNPSWRNPNPWQEIIAPNREKWVIAPDVQAEWENAVKSQGLWSNPGAAGNAFRGWMTLKNAWVPVKLALSAFHPLHVAHINLSTNLTRALNETIRPGQQSLLDRAAAIPTALAQTVADTFLALPWGVPFTDPFGGWRLPASTQRGKEIRQAWLTPEIDRTPRQSQIIQPLIEGGISAQLSEQLRISAKRDLSNAIRNRDVLGGIMPLGRRFIEGIQKPIFEHWIPNLKVAAYTRELESIARRRPDIMNDPLSRSVVQRAIGKQVDNRFGEMFYGGLFWNRTLKDAAVGSFLSLGWNLGFAREFVGGALEPAFRRMMSTPTPTRALIRDVTTKSTNMFLYSMTAMTINAMMTKAMTGEQPEGYDYIFPRIGGNNADGSPRRITNMFYTREVPMVKKNIEERQSIVEGLAQTLYHKMMFAPFVEMKQNRDYFGNPIYDQNSPLYKQAYQFLSHTLGEQLNPMSIVGAKKSLELSGKPHGPADIWKSIGDPDVYMPLLGFGPAPAYASRTTMQNRIYHAYGTQVAAQEKPYGVKEQYDERKAARDKYLIAKQSNDTEKMQEALQEGQKLGLKIPGMVKMRPGQQDIYLFSKLPPETQQSLMKDMNKDEFKRYFPKAKKDAKTPEIYGLWRQYQQ